MKDLPQSHETTVIIGAPAETVFAFLDDHRNLSAHMEQSSWTMLGSRMDVYFDAGDTRRVGSTFGLRGSILGIPLSVDEVVTRREPARLKVWETVGEPRLWVIGRYLMGFEVSPGVHSAELRVFIEYDLPKSWPARWLGLLLGNFYARWCTDRIAGDAVRNFQQLGAEHMLPA